MQERFGLGLGRACHCDVRMCGERIVQPGRATALRPDDDEVVAHVPALRTT